MTRVSLRPRAITGLQSASHALRLRINAVLGVLEKGSLPPHTEKLAGALKGYRTRIGRWRILFILQDGDIDVVDIFLKKGRGDYRRHRA